MTMDRPVTTINEAHAKLLRTIAEAQVKYNAALQEYNNAINAASSEYRRVVEQRRRRLALKGSGVDRNATPDTA